MAVYKDKARNTWFVQCSYLDGVGKRQRKTKRGFKTKREAAQWERDFLSRNTNALAMTLSAFYVVYEEDIKDRLKLNTWLTKAYIIEKKILPDFGNLRLTEITPAHIMHWQNGLIKYRDKGGCAYSDTYLRTICNQLSAIFNHAVRYYGLSHNPLLRAGKIGREKGGEMQYWTKEEYLRFADSMMDKPLSYMAFEILYWAGIREGELLALTPVDFDFNHHNLKITKSYQRLQRKDVVTSPKTPASIRTVALPLFLCEEMQDYLLMQKGLASNERVFPVTKSYLYREMDRGCKEQHLKRIRVHDLRHSHVSLLIELGYSAVAIAERLGHESIDITYRYAHLFPNKHREMAEDLNVERGDF